MNKLTNEVRESIENYKSEEIPDVSPQMVEEILTKSDKGKGKVIGDIPTKLQIQCSQALKFPTADLFTKITKSGKWPTRWKIEHSFTIKKIPNPLSIKGRVKKKSAKK